MALFLSMLANSPLASAQGLPVCEWPIPEFLCDPDPQLDADYDPVCARDCTTETYIVPMVRSDGTAETPPLWLLACQHNLILTTVTVFVVDIDETCDDGTPAPGWTPFRIIAEKDVVDPIGGPRLHVTTGDCAVSGVATIYGWGVLPFTEYVPCANVVPAP